MWPANRNLAASMMSRLKHFRLQFDQFVSIYLQTTCRSVSCVTAPASLLSASCSPSSRLLSCPLRALSQHPPVRPPLPAAGHPRSKAVGVSCVCERLALPCHALPTFAVHHNGLHPAHSVVNSCLVDSGHFWLTSTRVDSSALLVNSGCTTWHVGHAPLIYCGWNGLAYTHPPHNQLNKMHTFKSFDPSLSSDAAMADPGENTICPHIGSQPPWPGPENNISSLGRWTSL